MSTKLPARGPMTHFQLAHTPERERFAGSGLWFRYSGHVPTNKNSALWAKLRLMIGYGTDDRILQQEGFASAKPDLYG